MEDIKLSKTDIKSIIFENKVKIYLNKELERDGNNVYRISFPYKKEVFIMLAYLTKDRKKLFEY